MISIIIPIFNEVLSIQNTLKNLEGLTCHQIIFSDGGSTDGTLALIPKSYQIVHSKKGRAVQMNTAAQQACHDLLFFMHCDSTIDAEGLQALEESFVKQKADIAGLTLKFHDSTPLLDLIAYLSNKRIDLLKVIFGDQGILMSKAVFKATGGFKDIAIMEDLEFFLRVRKHFSIARIPTVILTSPRRFEQKGTIKTICLMHYLKILFLLGVDPQKIQNHYKDIR